MPEEFSRENDLIGLFYAYREFVSHIKQESFTESSIKTFLEKANKYNPVIISLIRCQAINWLNSNFKKKILVKK